MKIAVFALQGAFVEHEQMLARLGVDHAEIRRRADFTGSFDGVILPGGESTVQGKLLREEGMLQPLKEAIEGGLPVFGTCAGMILLAKRIVNDEAVHLGTMSAVVRRNAYGRQLGSFRHTGDFGDIKDVPMVFIRAPIVDSILSPYCPLEGKVSQSDERGVGLDVQILSTVNGNIVAARERNMLATAFHPELTDDTRVHEYFMNMIKNA